MQSLYGFANRHIFLELATGGDLFSYMAKNGTLCEGEAKFVSYQLMKGLEVCPYVPRDTRASEPSHSTSMIKE